MTSGSKDLASSGTRHESADGTVNTIVLKTEQVSEGIKESEELIQAVREVAEWIKKSLANGKFDVEDLLSAITLIPSVWSGGLGSEKIIGEYLHANGEERDKIFKDLKDAAIEIIAAFKG